MTSATTRAAIRAELFNQVPGLGFAATADSVTATTLTHAYVFEDTTTGANYYRGMYLYRPSASTAANYVRKITTVVPSTGVISIGGPNYSDTTTLPYEIVGLLHPDELNACIQRAMRRVYFQVQSVLPGQVNDGDMDASTAASWAGVNATPAKVTTPAYVYSGVRSLEVTNSLANGYASSNSLDALAGEWYYVSAVVKCASGTAELTVLNNNTSIGISNVISAEPSWTHVWGEAQFPAGCNSARVLLAGLESNADIIWAHVVFYRRDQLSQFPAPTWLDEQYKFQKLRQASYVKPLMITNTSNIGAVGYDDGQSRIFKDWYSPAEFELDPLNKDSNPYQIQLMRSVPREELWLQCKRPYADLEALALDTDTTLAPLNQVYAVAKEELARLLRMRYPQDKRWENLYTEASQQVVAETEARPELPLQPIKREFRGRI